MLPSLVASGGLWVGISTGYRRAGLLFEKHRDHFGRDGDDVLCVSGATEVFNPLIDRDAIAKAREQDPEAAEAEWDGGFRRDIAAFLTDHDIDAAVDHDRPMELGPRSGLRYNGFCRSERWPSRRLLLGHWPFRGRAGRRAVRARRGAWCAAAVRSAGGDARALPSCSRNTS